MSLPAASTTASTTTPTAAQPPTPRIQKRKKPKEPDRVLIAGRPDFDQCDNKVVSARYTIVTFFPVAITEQFRRFANMYFLIIGCIMAGGTYTNWYESAISPWTTLGPLAFVISISLLVEGNADYKRHLNDAETNGAPCVILRRTDELKAEEGAERDPRICNGKDVIVNINKAYYSDTIRQQSQHFSSANSIGDISHDNNSVNTNNNPNGGAMNANVLVAFQKVRRMDIRQGHFVLVKNREMVPADMLLLASSNDHGSAYIETSSIDGETNLKLRSSPHLPAAVLHALREGSSRKPGRKNTGNSLDNIVEVEEEKNEDEHSTVELESLEAATKRLTRFSYLGRPTGKSALEHPSYTNDNQEEDVEQGQRGARFKQAIGGLTQGVDKVMKNNFSSEQFHRDTASDGRYVAALTTEPPNPSVHTFSGKLTLPPFDENDSCHDIPLGAENVLLRGAVIRNTEWVIGLAFFTGTDTKLVQNSFKTPSKFSQLDRLMNKTVLAILCIMVSCIVYLAAMAVKTNDDEFDDLFYVGYNIDPDAKWPYLPANLEAPEWKTKTSNWLQYFLLYVTLLNNFIPLSLYVTVEFITFIMLYFVYFDKDMYDDTTNTRAVARSTNVTDLGRIQYIFSDKTGTLTQNVMRFKRCSVDGMIFGAPIQKSRPGAQQQGTENADDDDDSEEQAFHPLRHLLVGRFQRPSGLQGLGGFTGLDADNKLTFNAEMFLRVLCLCHTVVVEKDIDKKDHISGGLSVSSSTTSGMMSIFRRKRADTAGSGIVSPLAMVRESEASDHNSADNNLMTGGGARARTASAGSFAPGQLYNAKGADGAPFGYAYQAESPDEGALVSAASSIFGFQVVSRDSSGIKIKSTVPSHFEDEEVIHGLKNNTISLKKLAAETASELEDPLPPSKSGGNLMLSPSAGFEMGGREETWAILAVNKFDSDRKRMSILLRSPPEFGSLPILFCKGADSAMLDPSVCAGNPLLQGEESIPELKNIPRPASVHERERDVSALTDISEGADEADERALDEAGWEMAQMLGIQAHLGDFAKEGLRTLVLGMRVLDEQECEEWLTEYKAAATSIRDRSALLTEAALKIERNLHIVGATAIEDKLQKGVPDTIATLEKAGIKLWVLTGDKRETAVEIGYSTHVLTPKMHLTEVADRGKHFVRTQMAMEFIRLVKMGKLVDYQKAALDESGVWKAKQLVGTIFFLLGKGWRAFSRAILKFKINLMKMFCRMERAYLLQDVLEDLEYEELSRMNVIRRRRNVRDRAERTIQLWLQSEEGQAHQKLHKQGAQQPDAEADELSLASEETPMVFNRATSAKSILKNFRNSGKLSSAELRKISLAHLTAQQAGGDEEPVVDEDALSLNSFFPGDKNDLAGDFDRRKRTLLERLFAIDGEVRKGRLRKHVKLERLAAINEAAPPVSSATIGAHASRDGPRALVIEGAALKHLLGDPELEEILFAVASNCSAVIACRVSPKQKALLVNLVRHNVKPEPVTLAIGDGANDVGMIQEAHVGVGISGKEGKQAVNASDFSISQFRFLEDLILIHGRWDFFRLSTVVLFSFYKNALMAGILIVFTERTVYSGTPLFDQWIIAMLNFVAGIPIIMLGLFDRCLSKEYVKKNPEVYKATRENELITFRTLVRWIALVFIHIFTLYYFTVPQQSFSGGITSAWEGLMRNNDRQRPGDGEGGDLKSVGTVTFSCMVILLAYKVLYESRSLVHGRWPAFTCRKDVGEGFASRLAYTWVGVTYGSVGFYFVALGIYQCIGRVGANGFSSFVDMANHIMATRSLSWMLMAFVPISAIAFDVCGKVFSNLFYPTQTQIHLEIESRAKMLSRRARLTRGESWRLRNRGPQ